jgi:SAM-dependent methyltransferase
MVFQGETKPEADFLEQVWNQYVPHPVRRVLEPACGSGRQVVELSSRGYELVGIDLNQPSLSYAQRKLKRKGLQADLRQADMSEFKLDRPVDAAYCLINTFRHLVTDEQAVRHLMCVADALVPGGVYVLGFHLIPYGVEETCIERWRGKSRHTQVSFTLSFDQLSRRRRLERMRINMLVRTGGKEIRCRAEYPMRIYTAKQWGAVYQAVPQLELIEIFDFDYDLEITRELDEELADAVFVFRRRSPTSLRKPRIQ